MKIFNQKDQLSVYDSRRNFGASWLSFRAILVALFLLWLNLCTAQTITVTGSIFSNSNGCYDVNGTQNGKPKYDHMTSITASIYWDGSRWVLDNDGEEHFNSTDIATPPNGLWGPTSNVSSSVGDITVTFSSSGACTPSCSITSISATTPTCNGENATFDVSFTASGGTGTIEVVEQQYLFSNGQQASMTVFGSGTSSPITVTIPGPTMAGSKIYTVRYANNTSCSGTVNVSLPTCRPALTIKSGNELMFGDPCSCDDPRNCNVGGTDYFHDTLTVTATTGLTITAAAGATNFYTSVDCFGGSTGLIASGTPIPESPAGSGTYKIEFWRPSGAVPTLSVIEGGVTTTVPAATFQPVCTTATCTPQEPIPTMSEWGLLIFGLLIMNLSVFFVQRRELI